MLLVLLIVLIILMASSHPGYGWGSDYRPFGGFGLLVLILVILLLTGYVRL